jgi:hypothetical protein
MDEEKRKRHEPEKTVDILRERIVILAFAGMMTGDRAAFESQDDHVIHRWAFWTK